MEESIERGIIDRGTDDELIVGELRDRFIGPGLLIVYVIGETRVDDGHDGTQTLWSLL